MRQAANEPILEYKKGSKERVDLEKELDALSKNSTIVPVRIGTKSITGKLDRKQVMPSDHQTVIAKYTFATADDIREAIEVGLEA
ncbi:hypothetical protein ANCDUO_26243, partial [Ancylostoma duodenale]